MANITSTLRRIVSEISYADRRALEIRTGGATKTRAGDVRTFRRMAELDAAHTLNHRNY